MQEIEASPYTTRGQVYTTMPIPPMPENCLAIAAGPVRFVLESRALNTVLIAEHEAKFGSTHGAGLEDDGGASLHVFGTEDGLEHLRFDCFEKQPHYHYVRNAEQLNQVVMIDDIAVDPIDWTLLCVRERLPEMLEFAGAVVLAAAVRADRAPVTGGVDKVSEMIRKIAA